MASHRICYVTSEIRPFATTGGLGDVSAALPSELHRLGHEVRVFAPLYSTIDVERYDFAPVDGLQELSMKLGRTKYPYSLFRATMPGVEGLEIFFVHCSRLYDRPTLYTADADEHMRFLLLSHVSLEVCQRWGWAPDIVHCHDWQTALIPLYLKSVYSWDRLFRFTRSVLTIHNLGYQGAFSSDILKETGLSNCAQLLHREDLREGRIGFLKNGILHADLLTTVSPTYAREIQTEAFGIGLDELLRHRSHTLVGIRNGIDTEVWNPSTDEHLKHPFSWKTIARKKKEKEALLEDVGLPHDPKVPVVGMVTRLTYQKGIDLLFDCLPELLEARTFQLAVLGSGEAKYERFFSELSERFPTQVFFYRGFHTELSHRIEGGSDMFLMPSLYEPCGLNQMYSLAYGTIPIVRKTGGLADTVQSFDPTTGEGNGIVFDHPTGQGVRWGLETAIDLYAQPELWKQLIKNAMSEDFSWKQPVEEYVQLYDRIAAEKKEKV